MAGAPQYPIGKIIGGSEASIHQAYDRFHAQKIDVMRTTDTLDPFATSATTLAGEASVEGPGTFEGNKRSHLTFKPSEKPGWWIRRKDLNETLDTQVSIRNVWTSARNIVLRSGNPHNYLRMVEHIVALRLGLGVDNVLLEVNSGDPPLFDRSSLDLVEAMNRAQITTTSTPATYIAVKEPITFGGPRGDFLTILPPADKADHRLRLDTAIDFRSAIGQQRIVFDVTPETFTYGAGARTNATYKQLLLTRTIGKLFADTRHLGYTKENILIHGAKRYINPSRPEFVLADGQTLEPVWHRATLDLLAALSLLDLGRLVGTVVSYRAGHTLDVRLMTLLYLHDLLETV